MAREAESFTLVSECDGLPLSGLCLLPEGAPRAAVQLTHGMCEHKERYLPLMRYLAQGGFACFIIDHRGHGGSVKSPDDLGYFYEGGGDALVRDMELLTRHIKSLSPDLPLFLFGHSMGSLAARVYAKRYDDEIDGLIVCGSPSRNPAAPLGKAFLRVVAAFRGDRARSNAANAMFSGVFNKKFKSEGENAWVCGNRDVVEAYNADPLCHFSFTVNGYLSLLYLMGECYDEKNWQMKNPALPVRFLSGELDPCRVDEAHFCDAVETMRRVGYQNVTSRVFPDMRHEIHNEAAREIVFYDIAETLDDFLSARASRANA